jgi:hypothetical protein
LRALEAATGALSRNCCSAAFSLTSTPVIWASPWTLAAIAVLFSLTKRATSRSATDRLLTAARSSVFSALRVLDTEARFWENDRIWRSLAAIA